MKVLSVLLMMIMLNACVETTTNGLDTQNPLNSGAETDPIPSGNGQVTLTWLTPSENVDGSALNDLAGFRIYYQTARGTRQSVVDLSTGDLGAGLPQYTYTIEALPAPDTYQFSISAFDQEGNESALSGAATAVVEAI